MNHQDLLGKYKNEFPVPVVSLAKELGLNVYETYDFEDSKSGAIRKEKDGFVIYVNAKHPLARKRFTIAHEIAHFLNDQDYFETHDGFDELTKQPSFAELKRGDQPNGEERNREIRANKFAAELLMPENKFREIYEDANSIEEIANYFQVSTSAASIRANQLFNTVFI